MIPFRNAIFLILLFFFSVKGQVRSQSVEFFTSPIIVEVGTSFCVDIQVNDFVNILSMQFSMHWDPDIIRFDSIENYSLPFGDGNDFGYPDQVGLGTLTMSLLNSSLEEVNFSDGASIFQLCFTALEEGVTGITIDGDPTAIEVADFDFNELDVVVGESVINVGAPMALVWPGDTNLDEVVDHFDLLNIGLAFGQTGPARDNATINWEAQPSEDWEEATPISDVNFLHVDTDGNGLIEADDTLAIVQNWGEETNFQGGDEERFNGEETEALNDAPPIYILPDTLAPGEIGTFDIVFGDDANPAADVYGLAFSIIYDANAIEENSVSVRFEESWLGEIGLSTLGLSKDYYSENRIDVVVTRINSINQSGQGKIGSLKFVAENSLPIGEEYDLVFDIQDVKLINFSEEEIEAMPLSTTGLISDEMTNAEETLWTHSIKVYPNPVGNQLYIESPSVSIEQIKIFSPQGQLLLVGSNGTNEVDLTAYSKGTYYLQLVTSRGVSNHLFQKL